MRLKGKDKIVKKKTITILVNVTGHSLASYLIVRVRTMARLCVQNVEIFSFTSYDLFNDNNFSVAFSLKVSFFLRSYSSTLLAHVSLSLLKTHILQLWILSTGAHSAVSFTLDSVYRPYESTGEQHLSLANLRAQFLYHE